MQADRELLEFAARAAGVDVTMIDQDGQIEGYDVNGDAIVLKGWNPLTDDGDALRLAVKLQLDISVGFSLAGELRCRAILDEDIGASEPAGDDHCAAARRAIVRAAAEIGKASLSH